MPQMISSLDKPLMANAALHVSVTPRRDMYWQSHAVSGFAAARRPSRWLLQSCSSSYLFLRSARRNFSARLPFSRH